MEFGQLRTLIHVAELGSLSKAADRLRIAQPALSRQVRMLEEELGIELFTRHGRGMVLTEQGRDVLKHAMRISSELEEIRAGASDVEAPFRFRQGSSERRSSAGQCVHWLSDGLAAPGGN